MRILNSNTNNSSSASNLATPNVFDILFPVTREPSGVPNWPLSVSDLELMHQYTTSTYLVLGDGHAGLWREAIPRIGLCHNFVLHLVLTISSLELRKLRWQSSQVHETTGEAHFSAGIHQAAVALSTVGSGNAQAVLAATMMVVYCILARGPKPGDYMLFSGRSQPEWLTAVRGVRSIVTRFGQSALFRGPLEYVGTHSLPRYRPVCKQLQWQTTIDWETPLSDLRQFLETLPDQDEATYTEFETLSAIWTGVYGKGEERVYQGDIRTRITHTWPILWSDDFLEHVQEKKDGALLLIAYYTPLLLTLETTWLSKGWSQHVLSGVRTYLDPAKHRWLSWPEGIVNGAAGH